ncbi:MAG TPA: cupin domain-containing protein [Candidatus Dormibacteraeota bacterium]|nr:cupin domain-containing protein [Candidatus Dormibacteraeota bacterium]
MAGRVFLKGLEGERYDLRAHRRQRLAAPHVVHQSERAWRDEQAVGHEDASPRSRAKWMVGPGDDPFLTQTVQCHFVAIDPGGSNGGHGHQNEAAFYILQGQGYEIHDDRRYDWSAGDLVVVHNDCRHQHFNASPTEPALAIVVKPKCTWMMLGLTQQGRDTTVAREEADGFGPRQDWSRLWTPGVDRLRKVVHADQEPWQDTPDGRIKWLARPGMDVRLFGIDVWLEQLAPGPAPRHWHMADELYYVLEGSGHTLEWQVEAEIAERYYARVALRPCRHDWSAGDVVYVPQNTVHRHVAGEGGALLLGAQNRLFRLLGYDATVYPDLEAGRPGSGAPVGEEARV